MGLLGGVMVPLVTPMSAPGRPAEADDLLRALAGSGVRSLMLFGTNGEGPLLPAAALTDFARWAVRRWRELTGGPVLCTVTAAGTAEVLERVAAVAPAGPDALVLSPPIYFRHRPDEIAAHYAALSDVDVPVVAYNAPRYANPLDADLVRALAEMPHVTGVKDSSGDLGLLGEFVRVAKGRPGFEVSQGAETKLLAALRLGADGVVPGLANLAPRLAVELVTAHEAGRDDDAEAAQRALDRLFALHTVRPGVPSVKAILHHRGLCAPHVAPPLAPCSDDELRDLLALVGEDAGHLLSR
ncbi:dihydrodipicolinate synthase family protein [Amycolatopsis deserti]|uniref:Dihydrodipicolinate synthase family protein n=1 Tax=Amycolatopsis deserti TaxID=185696 RepID=A0ABQ3IFH3_9PSEU|nr:dihydrodipicolinate synthase family protein [Amycolatopsis deserti]GHE79240.1 dihydrodipicolinate synthase family protein [Amycolatopsis deserti]